MLNREYITAGCALLMLIFTFKLQQMVVLTDGNYGNPGRFLSLKVAFLLCFFFECYRIVCGYFPKDAYSKIQLVGELLIKSGVLVFILCAVINRINYRSVGKRSLNVLLFMEITLFFTLVGFIFFLNGSFISVCILTALVVCFLLSRLSFLLRIKR
jgi:hypothetical protein